MKRTFPRRVKPVAQRPGNLFLPGVVESAVVSTVPAAEANGAAKRLRQLLPEPTRSLRQSVAVLGLAVSVGAAGLLLTQQKQRENRVDPIPFSSRTLGQVLSQNSEAKYKAAEEALSSGEFDEVGGLVVHTVEPGQTLWQLTQIYQVDAAAITVSNGISASTELKPGQVLVIPPVNGLVHRVRSGETLESIARFYQVGQKDIARYSQLTDSDFLSIGQELVIPGKVAGLLKIREDDARRRLEAERDRLKERLQELQVSSSSDAAATRPQATHRVQSGDTVETIARNYGVPQRSIIEANNLTDPSWLRLNQELRIPARPSPGSNTSVSLSLNTRVAGAQAANSQPARPQVARAEASTTASPNDSPAAAPNSQAPAAAPAAESLPKVPAISQSVPAVASPRPVHWNDLISLSNRVRNQGVEALATAPAPTPAAAPAPRASAAAAPKPTLAVSRPRAEEPSLPTRPSPAQAERSTTALAIPPAPEPAPDAAPTAAAVAQPRPVIAAVAPTPALVPAEAGPSSPAYAGTDFTPAPAPEELQRLESEVETLQARVREAEQTRLEAEARARQATAARTQAPTVARRDAQPLAPELPGLDAQAYVPQTGSSRAVSASGFIWPAQGVLTSGFGRRWGRLHAGLDIAAPVGTPIFAAAEGQVLTAGWDSGGYGYKIDILHSDGTVTRYAHLSRILVQVGQQVSQGSHIAAMGSTGFSTGPHLHFEIRPSGGRAVNPMPFLR